MNVTNPTLKPYPAYKDSGVPWLGEIPAHWEYTQLRRLCKVFSGGTPDKSNTSYWIGGSIPWLSSGEVNKRRIHNAEQTITKEGLSNSSAKWIPAKSVVMALAGQGKTKGMVATLEFATTCNQSLAAICPKLSRIDYGFLAYYLESKYREIRGLVGDGLRDGLNLEILKSIVIPVPQLCEQEEINQFLTHIDTRVNRLIRIKRRMIALLNEQKQAIIHRAVTRGLDPDVRLKPSGVAWLGEVPEHWEVIPLRLRYSVQLGKMLDAKRITGKHLVPYLRNIDVQWNKINVIDLPVMDIEPSEYERYTVRTGDLLVCEGGEVGRSAFWSDNIEICGFQKALHRVRPYSFQRDNPQFLYYVMYSASKIGVFLADGSENTIAHLTSIKFRRHRIAFPSRDEQEQISTFLDMETRKIETAITRTQREIDLIREYRTRLVADVVTGKLDVRGVDLAAYGDELAGLDEALADEDDVGEEEIDEVEEDAG